jgi:pilus assembly protein CpaB
MQKPKISRNLLYIIIAVVMAILAALIAVSYVQKQVDERTRDDREMIRVAVPVEDMPQGAIIGEGDLATRSVPAELAPADAVTPENHEEYTGRMLRAPIRGGAPLSAAALVPLYDQFSRIIPRGKVAYTLSVDENNSISGMIAPGDMIDILFMKDAETTAGTGTGNGVEVLPLLNQVKVLATGSRVGERITAEGEVDQEAQGFSSVTLELDRWQANQLAVASKAGNLRVLLRELNDTSPGSSNGLSENELLHSLGAGGAARSGSGIEFIIGGKG